ncbi:transporter substrate-binding domain-containing protein [Shewanella sp. T24-MNA-CIBAN-0130]|uniref:substrate-binding periplasmic protein n=1 Tax=Shewanella sp. T24-MNA-CIBAN-0130 TaxID=3140470 RepID=UPI00332EF93A
MTINLSLSQFVGISSNHILAAIDWRYSQQRKYHFNSKGAIIRLAQQEHLIKDYMSLIGYPNVLLGYILTGKVWRIFAQVTLLALVSACVIVTPKMAVAESLRITLAAEDSWPPFADEVGRGISHNIINHAFEQVDVEVSTIVVPYSRGLIMTERGTVDGVFNVTREQSTIDRFVFGNEPLFTVTASFFFAKEYPTIVNNKWQIPAQSTIGIVNGYEYGDEFMTLVEKLKLHVITVNSQRQLINLLLVGRIDAAIMYDLVADVYINQMGVSHDIKAKFNNHTSEIFVAFSKHNPQAKHLSQLLDKGLLTLQKQGKYHQLLLPANN